MSNTINFGIDLGTTNSAIAKYHNGQVEVFRNPTTLKQTLSSVIAYKPNRKVVGDKARELLGKSNISVFGGFKRKMGTSDKYFEEISEEFVSPIELSSIILMELRNFIHTGESPSSAVITIPAAFDTMQSNATKKAGIEAGFSEVVLLQEPIAASLAFANNGEDNLNTGKWLVYDFGGGTFDVALASIVDKEMKILDHEGDNYLGGTDIDRAIIDKFIIPNVRKIAQVDDNISTEIIKPKSKYNKLYNKLLFLAEEAKIELTTQDTAEIEFEITDIHGQEHEIFLEMNKPTFESIVTPFVMRTIDMVSEILNRNDLASGDISRILLIGGSTYIPIVRTLLEDMLTLKVDTSMDPTVAVVVGAAYYAGTKTVSHSSSTLKENKLCNSDVKIKTAYERIVQTTTNPLLIKVITKGEGESYRITRKDGGYDSGMIILEERNKSYLPVEQGIYNTYELAIYDNTGIKIYTEEVGITHGKFKIDGQPLPENICMVLDAVEENTTFLEPIFTKNSILPLKKTITKQVSKTIPAGSTEKLILKIVEGKIDTLPSANKIIGLIEIDGQKLERTLVAGSDVDITFEISESRDLTIIVYLALTDQEFLNTFSSSDHDISISHLLNDTRLYKVNLDAKRSQFEFEDNYEKAGEVQNLLDEIENIESEILGLDITDMSDNKYQVEIKKRNLGHKIHKFYNNSLLTLTIEKYYTERNSVLLIILQSDDNEKDLEAYNRMISDEKEFLRKGNIAAIKVKCAQLESMKSRVLNRNRRPATEDDIIYAFRNVSSQKFKNTSKSENLIKKGYDEMNRKDIHGLYNTTLQLIQMQDEDKNNNSDLFRSDKTGLK